MANSGPHSMGAKRWKCPLCDKMFSKEHDMDMHMVTDCPYQNPVDVRGRAGSSSAMSHKKKSPQLTGGNLTGKQSVILTWEKEVNTCEREVFFFHKSGNMFELTQQTPKQYSSLNSAIDSSFVCKCELEVGEHEGSLNIGDSGVHEISPFTVKNQSRPLIVVLKLVNNKTKSNQVKERKPEASSQHPTSKQTTNEIARYQTELKTLQTKSAAEKKEFLEREEIHRQEIAKLKAILFEKDKIISFNYEKVENLEVELGRYSEKSQEMFDKLEEDKSKYKGYDKKLEGMKQELEQRTNELMSLKREKQDVQEKYQNEMSHSKLCVECLNKECSLSKIELEKKSEYSQHNLTTESAETEKHIQSLTARIRELEDRLTTKDTHISQLYSELEIIRIHYSNLEKELQSLKSVNQPRSRDGAQLCSNTYSQMTPDTRISQFKTKFEDLQMELTLKHSECEDLQKKVTSLQSELKEAQDLLASKLDSTSGFRESFVGSVHLSLPPGFKRSDIPSITSQSADVDHVRVPKKQMKELEANIQDLKSEISHLKNLLVSKETQSAILKINLDDLTKELDNARYRLQLQQTQKSNPAKVQSKEDLQTGTVVKEKQAQSSQVVPKLKQQPKYTTTRLCVNGQYSSFYSLNQADHPSDFVGELVVCKSKSKCVIGTLKVVIPATHKNDKTIAGIEFTGEFGDSSGSYKGIPYFTTKFRCALFLPTTEVYMSYNVSPK